MKFCKASGKSAGRKPEAQIKDLCKAVERVILHLKKLEKKSESKSGE